MRNGVDIRDLDGLEAATSQLPLIGFTVLRSITRSSTQVSKRMRCLAFR